MFNDIHDEVGANKRIINGCGTEEELSKYIPQNGEYSYVDGEEDHDNCCGKERGYYKRDGYLADADDCCKNLNPIIDGQTCDPEFRGPFAEKCKETLTKYCSADPEGDAHKNTIFTKPVCKLWCAKNTDNKATCDLKKKTLCDNPDNIKFPECKKWCLEHPGQCDDGMAKYCKEPKNSHDPVCACLHSFVEFKDRKKNNPKCVDNQCIVHGYSTAAMMHSPGVKCENITCSVYYGIDKTDRVNINKNIINQTCGEETTVPHSTLQKIKSHPWFNFSTTLTEEHKKVLIISSLMLLLFIIMIMVVYKKK
jgi:hypothetical protein